VLLDRAMAFRDLRSLVMSFIQSDEFFLALETGRIVDRCDSGVLEAFSRSDLIGSPNHVTDFMGARISTDLIAWAHNLGGVVEPIPTLRSLCGEFCEWKAILTLLNRIAAAKPSTVRVVEVGSAFGPWLATAGLALQRLGHNTFSLIGVEAAPEFEEGFHKHMAANGLSPFARWVEGAVLDYAGQAAFPRITAPSMEFHHRAQRWDGAAPLPSNHRAVPAMTLQDLVHDVGEVDLLMLTSGDEIAALASLDWASAPVSALMVATSSVAAPGRLWQDLAGAGWRNLLDVAPRSQQDEADPRVVHVLQDGCQAWINPSRIA
jgi:hypothetical protein